ncbi:hypothetical protein [Gordonia soli]|uniref:Uncharacterized protein n=1 Tax=Gordonia soli NBRC 108243 TaxID=1223545 RepID=M0QFQ3_9ACTN|nr:hypothetical protein [Gordonia soli]GAC67430.1 hypothetical protein GS4_08_00140 [Gordonia soli NBRC 108243]
MVGVRRLVVAVAIAVLAVVGAVVAPSASPVAHAATNCSTLPSRIAATNADARNYNAQVAALNARGGGTPGQVAYYRSWKARGNAHQGALRAELARCQSQGQLTGIRPPSGPGTTVAPPRTTPPRPAPRQTNPTPGFAPPQNYARGAGVVSDRTTAGGTREVRFRDGGTVSVWGLRGGRSSGITGYVSIGMRDRGTAPVRQITPRGLAGKYSVRGQLLANRLGGLGGDARNIVPITPRANAQKAAVEGQVYRALQTCRGGKVNYTVLPVYGRSAAPERLIVRATGCGLDVQRMIPNV